MRLRRLIAFSAASLVFTYAFFLEYLPPFRRVHIPYDLAVYHYSLADYAFRALRQGRFPLWDPSIFSGMGFASNIQAAVFYPPMWILFALSRGREHLPYIGLEIFQIAHFWLAFVLCYVWLRGRELSRLASLLGAGVYAFSGYVCLSLQHLGVVAAYAWTPLGLLGIDQAAERRRWTPWLKLVAASALAFLGGYPPAWFVFAVAVGVYTVCRSFDVRTVLGTLSALLASLAIAAVQLWPSWEASVAKLREARYGAGLRDPWFYLSYLIPNYFNFGLNVSIFENPGKEYLYLGAPAILGMALLFRRRHVKTILPLLAVGIVGLLFMINPDGIVWSVIRHSSLIGDVCRSFNFLALPPLAAASLAAYGIHDYLDRKARTSPNWLVPAAVVLAVVYSGSQIFRWAGTTGFAAGPASAIDAVLTIVLLALLLYVVRGRTGLARVWTAAAILMLVAVDYKVFGTRKRFDASKGTGPADYVSSPFPGMTVETFNQIHAHPEYRVMIDAPPGGPLVEDLRHGDFTTPQGFDPFFTAAYLESLSEFVTFERHWEFVFDPDQEDALRLYGVRYIITSDRGPMYPRLLQNPKFRLLERDAYFRVFEYLQAHPPFGWESESEDQRVEVREWTPERRGFQVESLQGGKFTLREQLLPGWQATVDGHSVPVERWKSAFQAVQVAPGSHRLEFRFSGRSVWLGAGISGASILMLAAAAMLGRRARN